MTATLVFNASTTTPTLLSRLFRACAKKSVAAHDPEAMRARRAFIMDRMMNDNAFASEYDVCEMMSHYPHEF
jgi:hypothetical protein